MIHARTSTKWLALAMAGTLALSGCAGADEGSDDTFDLVAVLSVSGPLSETAGIPSRDALEAGIEILNADGGIDGRPVELTVVDSAGDATKAVANLQAYLADNDKPDAVFGGEYSFEALPMAPILTQAGVLNLSSSITPALSDPEEFPHTFQQSIPVGTIIDVLAAHVAEEGHKKVAYLAVDDESGHSTVENFEKIAADYGLTVTDAYIPADSVDATAALEKLRAANPDVLLMSAVGSAAATMLKSRVESGWDIPAIGDGSAFSANDLGKISKPAYWDDVTVQTPNWQVRDSNITGVPAFDTFIEAYLERGGEMNKGAGAMVCLYENLLTIKAAYEESESDDVADLAQALVDIGSDGVPESIADYWVGPEGLGFTEDQHNNQTWDAEDFTFVPAQALVDGMAEAQ